MFGKSFRGVVVFALALGCIGSIASAQISPDEAMRRLREKQAARNADREKIVEIKKGELDDLKAEVAKLKAQVESLQNELAAAKGSASPQVKLAQALGVGLTHDEVMRFVHVHHELYEVTTDTPVMMKVMQKAKHKVFDGTTSSNGVGSFANYREQLRPDTEITLTMENGKVSSINQVKLDSLPDERQGYAGH